MKRKGRDETREEDWHRIDLAFRRIMEAAQHSKLVVKAILSEPCLYRPGSTDKIAVLAARESLGVPLNCPGDMVINCPGDMVNAADGITYQKPDRVQCAVPEPPA